MDDKHNSITPNITSPDRRYRLKSASVVLTKLESDTEFSPKRPRGPSVCWAEHSEAKRKTRQSTQRIGDETVDNSPQGSPSQFTRIKTRLDGNTQDNGNTVKKVSLEILPTLTNKKDWTNFIPLKRQEVDEFKSSLSVEDVKEVITQAWAKEGDINKNSGNDTGGVTNKDTKHFPSYSIIRNNTNATNKRQNRLQSKGVVHTVTIKPDFDNSSKNVVMRTQEMPLIQGENKTTGKNLVTKPQQVILPKREENIVIMPFAEKKQTTTRTKSQKSNDKLEKISEMLREKSSYVWPRPLIKEERKTPQKTKRQNDLYPNRSSKRKCSSLVKNESEIEQTESITGTNIDTEHKVKLEEEDVKTNKYMPEDKNNKSPSKPLSNEKKESTQKTKTKLKTELVVNGNQKEENTTGNNKKNSLWSSKTFSGCMLVSACAATVKIDEKRQQRTIPTILSRSKNSKFSPVTSKVKTDISKSKKLQDKVTQGMKIENNKTGQNDVTKRKERTGRKQTYTNIKPWMFPSLQNRLPFCRPFPTDLPTWSQFSMLFQESNGYSLETQHSLYTYYNDMCRNYYKNINAAYPQYNARATSPAGSVGSSRGTNMPNMNTLVTTGHLGLSNPQEALHNKNTKFPNVNMFPLAAIQQQINKVGGYITPNARWVPYHNQRADKNTSVTYAGKHFNTQSRTANTLIPGKASTKASQLPRNPENMKTQSGVGNHKFILPRSGGNSLDSVTGKYTQAATNMAVKETSVVLDKLRIGKPFKASNLKSVFQKDNKFLEVTGGSLMVSSVKHGSDVTSDNSGKADTSMRNDDNCTVDASQCNDNSNTEASQCNDNCTSNAEDRNTLSIVYALKQKPCDEIQLTGAVSNIDQYIKNNTAQAIQSNAEQAVKGNAEQVVKCNIVQSVKSNTDQDIKSNFNQAIKSNIGQNAKNSINRATKVPGIDLSKPDEMTMQNEVKCLIVTGENDQKKPNVAETTECKSQQNRVKSDNHETSTDVEGDSLHLYDHAYTKTPDSSPCKAGASNITNQYDYKSVSGDLTNKQVPVYAVTYGNKLLLLSANKIESNKLSSNKCQSDSILKPTGKLISPRKRQVNVSTARKKRTSKQSFKNPAVKGISRKRVNFAKHLYLGRSSSLLQKRKSETVVEKQEKTNLSPKYMCAVCICIDKNDLNSLTYTVSTLSITLTGDGENLPHKENSFYKVRLTYDLEVGDLKHLETECLTTGFYHIADKCSVGRDVNRYVEAATLVPYPADIDDLPEMSSWIAIGKMQTIFDPILPKVPSGDLQSLLKSVLPKDSFISSSINFMSEEYRPKRDARIWYEKHYFDYFTKKYCCSNRTMSASSNKDKNIQRVNVH